MTKYFKGLPKTFPEIKLNYIENSGKLRTQKSKREEK